MSYQNQMAVDITEGDGWSLRLWIDKETGSTTITRNGDAPEWAIELAKHLQADMQKYIPLPETEDAWSRIGFDPSRFDEKENE